MTTTNTRTLNVKNIIVANTLMEKLIDFIRENKEHWCGKADDLENNAYCVQARAIWTTIALLENISPDTYTGDMKIMELWDSCGLQQADENEFDLFMWSDLC
jgi:hypothetical protein